MEKLLQETLFKSRQFGHKLIIFRNQGRNNLKRRRGIYLLPNLFTTAGLFAGFYGIVSAMNSQFESAAIAIFIAMVMDGMDGRIARLTKTQSDFGVEYDSLADMISFGLAPSLIVYQWILSGMGKLGWLVAFIYTASTALRLARFNTQVMNEDKQFFQGLPSPAAAALVAGMIWLGETQEMVEVENLTIIALPITVLAGILMVSNIRFYSFKEIDFKGRIPFVGILLLVLLFVFIASEPPLILFSLSLIYTISGPVITLFLIRKHRMAKKS